MRINPITCNYNSFYTAQKKEKNANYKDSGSNFANISMPESCSMMPIFRSSTNNSVLQRIQKASLSDKLTVAIANAYNTDIIVVCKNLKDTIPKLKQRLDRISLPIAKLTHIPVNNNQTIVIGNCTRDGIKILNINSEPILLSSLDTISPEEMKEVEYGEMIRIDNNWVSIDIELTDETDFLEKHQPLFMKTIDSRRDITKFIAKHNLEIMDKILEEKEEAGQKRKEPISFNSVGGQDKNIEIIKKRLLYPLKYPEVFEGYMNDRGVVLAGPPGTGKSLMMKALASEAKASYYELSATELSKKYVGESEETCRKVFKKAVENQPSIICFDEFDALAKARGGIDTYGDKLLNQFLSCMSDLEKNGDNVVVVASTNRKDSLDPAVMRSGRFGLVLEINPPDLEGIKQIFKIHTKGKQIDEKIDSDALCKRMLNKRMTGADIASIVNTAFMNALESQGIYESMENGSFNPQNMENFKITAEDFNKAIDDFSAYNAQKRPVGYHNNK